MYAFIWHTKTLGVYALELNRFSLRKMDEQQQRMFDEVAKKFNSSGKALKEDVNRLQQWLETQTHLPKILGTFLTKFSNFGHLFC